MTTEIEQLVIEGKAIAVSLGAVELIERATEEGLQVFIRDSWDHVVLKDKRARLVNSATLTWLAQCEADDQ